MHTSALPMMETEKNGCRISLSFAEKPVDGVIERLQSILSNAYDERVQTDLMELVNAKSMCR